MSMQILSILVTIFMVVVGLLVYFWIQRKKNPRAAQNTSRGYGSQKAVRILRAFSNANDYRFISPVPLADGQQLEALCVGEFGILGVKTYGYNGHIYGNAADKQWLYVGHEDVREYFANPTLEANQDVQTLRKALQNTKARNAPIEIVAVFTNAKAQLAVEKKAGVLRTKDFKALLGRDKYQKQNGVDQDLVANTFQGS